MLFLGTKSYPKEDSFEAFLSSNGGSSNAFTDSENTVYYFSMEAESSSRTAEALARFGSFFTDPLFTESSTSRELNAIESENQKNLQTDSFRTYQMNKARANPDHPFSKFFTGNKRTLLDDTKAQGINLRNELIRFYNRYYSSNQMTLAVVGPNSLPKLQEMVERAFGSVPNRHVAAPESAWNGVVPPFNGNSLVPSYGSIVEMVPVQDLRQLSITWPIVYSSGNDVNGTGLDRSTALLVKPVNYVAHLLGHEGPGSLCSYLKRRGWASLVACSLEEELSDFECINVVIGLTTQGLEARDEVVEAVFSYISLIRDRRIPDYVFDEVLQLDELSWRFLTRGSTGGYVQSLAGAMQKYPPSLYVAGPRRLALDIQQNVDRPLSGDARVSFNSAEQRQRTVNEVTRYIQKLTVENAWLTVQSQSFSGQTDRKEPWYGTDYRVYPIPESVKARWRKCKPPKALSLDFPKPNTFIPSESGLRVRIPRVQAVPVAARTFDSRMTPISPPRRIRHDGPGGRWSVYFKEDDRFGQPKAYVIFQLLTNGVYSTPNEAALANFYELSVSDALGEYAYNGKLILA
jgi:insulysin